MARVRYTFSNNWMKSELLCVVSNVFNAHFFCELRSNLTHLPEIVCAHFFTLIFKNWVRSWSALFDKECALFSLFFRSFFFQIANDYRISSYRTLSLIIPAFLILLFSENVVFSNKTLIWGLCEIIILAGLKWGNTVHDLEMGKLVYFWLNIATF